MSTGIVAGKLAFVTGAGGGIGRAVCNVLAREGAKVIVADQNFKATEQVIAELKGTEHMPVQVDVKCSDSIKTAFCIIKNRYSTCPTIIVNSAGITRDNFLLKFKENDFTEVIDVNLKGTFLVTQIAAKQMIQEDISKIGTIINIGSIIGKTGNIGQSNYAASKAGVEAFTKSAAMEFGNFGIRVNAVLPGIIDTAMIETIPDNVIEMFIHRIPLKRIGKPEEVAELVLFLASKKSSYINGAAIEITGGL